MPAIIVFEDHTAEDFRPLAWSVPVHEMRCGLFSLRERLELLTEAQRNGAAAGSARLGLLPRGLLSELQEMALSPGLVAGAANCQAAAAAAGGALLLSARLGPDWEVLDALLAAGAAAQPWAWWREGALLAARLDPVWIGRWLAAWSAWDRAADGAGAWRRGGRRAPALSPGVLWSDEPAPPDGSPLPDGGRFWLDGRAGAETAAGALPTILAAAISRGPGSPVALGHLWDLVPAVGRAIVADVARMVAAGRPFARRLYGVTPDPAADPESAPWRQPGVFHRWRADGGGPQQEGAEIWTAAGARIGPGVVMDAAAGAIVIDRGARVEGLCYLQGPLYVGPGSLIKAGARLYGETALGAACKMAGEIGETQAADFVNKQHDGFIGHAVLGSWVNLGAGTTCSDLKNTYGTVRVDYGLGEVDSGLRFLGVMCAEHAKSAIGTLFNTATTVGFGSNVFGAGFPPKCLPNFTWGDPGGPPYDAARAAAVARTVMGRRGCLFTPAHERLFMSLAR